MRRRMRFRKRAPWYGTRRTIVPLLLTAAGSIWFFSYLSSQLSPLIETVAVSKTVNLVSLAVSEETDLSLAEGQIAYRDFVSVETDGDGRVTSLSFRTAESTAFKRIVIERLIRRLERSDPEELEVPLGTLSGVIVLSALGPSIRVRLQSVGDVTAEYENELTSAGVNQTKHSVYLNVTANVYLLIPGEIIPVSVTERVCVAETVIVGNVPDTYLNLKNGAD